MQQKKLLRRIEEAHRLLERTRTSLALYRGPLRKEGEEQLARASTLFAEREGRLRALEKQLDAILEAEHELGREMQSALEKKKEEIRAATQNLYRSENYEGRCERAEELSGLLEAKRERQEELEREIDQFGQGGIASAAPSFEATADLGSGALEKIYEEDVGLRKRLDLLRDGQAEL